MIGLTNKNTFGRNMKIINFNNSTHIDILFDNGYLTKGTYKNFLIGNIKNPYDKTNCNIGYVGEGKYKTTKNSKYIKNYNSWRGMMQRCYNPSQIKQRPEYCNCSVCDEWLNYQNFAKWYDENYYEVPNEKMQLDKDILVKGNKIYSPETCVFVPQNINVLFTKRQNKRGNTPIGVFKTYSKFEANCHNGNGKQIYLGKYQTIDEAFNAYKTYKEDIIKEMANKYYTYIPIKLYNALYNYKVDIND